MNFIYLLVAFVCCGVTGHIKVTNWSLQGIFSNPGFKSDIFSKNEFLVFLKFSQPKRKCCSVSMDWLLVCRFVCVLFCVAWQNTQKRSLYGVIGRVRRRISVAREWALIRRRVRADLWILLRTQAMYGSAAKHDLKVLWTLSLLWFWSSVLLF